MSAAGLRAQLRSGDLVVAAEATSASSGSIEILCGMSFDLVVIDARHAAVSPYSDELERLVRAADAHGGAVVVRVGQNTPGTINRVMNDGASGVIVAADDEEAAARAVRSVRYPPDGFRGAAPVVRAAHFGLVPWDDYREATNAARPVIISIESAAALDSITQLSATDGVDAVLLDVFNLGLALGTNLTPESEHIAGVLTELRNAQRIVGVTLPSPDDGAAWRDAGCSLIVIGNDVAAYAAATRSLRATLDAVPSTLGRTTS